MVEDYRRLTEIQDDLDYLKADGGQELCQVLRDIGMHDTARLHERVVRDQAKQDKVARLYPEISGKTLLLWQRFLPTVYQVKQSSYTYNVPSLEVATLIGYAQKLDCFDRIEIWTPEGNTLRGLIARELDYAQDVIARYTEGLNPMVVGILELGGQTHYYQIVRWGEALLPFSQVRRKVVARRWLARFLFTVLPILVSIIGLVAYYNGVVFFGWWPMIIGTAGTVLLVLIVYGGWRAWYFILEEW